MRTSSAVRIAAGIVAAKAALMGLVLLGWTAVAGRLGHIELGPLAEWLAALATFGAVIAALGIATRDRTDRLRERIAKDAAQARVVLVQVGRHGRGQGFRVLITNHGERPVLDVAVDSAQLAEDLNARWDFVAPLGPEDDVQVEPVLQAERSSAFIIVFKDSDGEPRFKSTSDDCYTPDPDDFTVSASVKFMDANGNWWRKSSSGDLVEPLNH
jgi:hypothetical protein